MENHLTKIYSQAKSDIGQKWYKYMESIKPEGDRLLKAYEDAKLTNDKDLIQETGKEYGQYLREKTYMNDRYKSMLNTTTTKLANVNETALAYLNDKMPKVYSVNYNELSDAMPAGISFDLVDETTVKNLVKDNPKLLPTKKLDISKDKRWNQKAINSQVLQGIIQGESVNKIAARLTPIMDRNRKSAIRNARTMTTSAQNKGRLDSYKAAQDSGVVLKKVWLATNSDRTRAWHSDLNGIELDLDEPFENDYGKIMFPGDPSAHPGNVYNCRCTLTTKIIGFKRKDGSIKYIESEEPASDLKPKGFEDRAMEYVSGGIDIDSVFTKEDLRYIGAHLTETNKPLYRVEDARFTANKLDEDDLDTDDFKFNGSYRSFSSDLEFIKDALDENSDEYAGILHPVIFEITGDTKAFDMAEYAKEYTKQFGDQSELLVGGRFEVIDEDMKNINGEFIRIIKIRQKSRRKR